MLCFSSIMTLYGHPEEECGLGEGHSRLLRRGLNRLLRRSLSRLLRKSPIELMFHRLAAATSLEGPGGPPRRGAAPAAAGPAPRGRHRAEGSII